MSGPLGTKGFYGERYFMILVDDFTRMMWVAFLKEKSKEFKKFKIFKNIVENEFGVKIKSLRFDRGGEFTLENSIFTVKRMESRDDCLHHIDLSRMRLLKEERDYLLKQQELYYLRMMHQRHFGESQSIQ